MHQLRVIISLSQCILKHKKIFFAFLNRPSLERLSPQCKHHLKCYLHYGNNCSNLGRLKMQKIFFFVLQNALAQSDYCCSVNQPVKRCLHYGNTISEKSGIRILYYYLKRWLQNRSSVMLPLQCSKGPGIRFSDLGNDSYYLRSYLFNSVDSLETTGQFASQVWVSLQLNKILVKYFFHSSFFPLFVKLLIRTE